MSSDKTEKKSLAGGGGLEQAVTTLKMLSHPERLRLLCLLIENGEHSVSGIWQKVELSQSALSQHLALLRETGLVETRKERQTVYYRIAREDIRRLIGLLHDLYCSK